jgi:hypothetical protein
MSAPENIKAGVAMTYSPELLNSQLDARKLRGQKEELRNALAALFEFWDNGTAIHPGAEVVEEARAVLKAAQA